MQGSMIPTIITALAHAASVNYNLYLTHIKTKEGWVSRKLFTPDRTGCYEIRVGKSRQIDLSFLAGYTGDGFSNVLGS